MSAFSEFYLNSKSSVAYLETIEISHSNFTQTHYVVRNNQYGMDAIIEDGTVRTFVYYPLKITATSQQDDLDQVFKIELGDLGELIPQELDRINEASNYSEKPVVKYRCYRSDNLDSVLYGPIVLELKTFVFTKEGCAFEARAPSLNVSKTGQIYTFERFPMLRGLL